MIHNMEKFEELVSLGGHELSGGMQLIVEKLQKTKESGFSVLDKKSIKKVAEKKKKF